MSQYEYAEFSYHSSSSLSVRVSCCSRPRHMPATCLITGGHFQSWMPMTAIPTQPDGASIYSWGYGCSGGTSQPANTFACSIFSASDSGPVMQMPAPTLIVRRESNHHGDP